jgi:hypothetical protein
VGGVLLPESATAGKVRVDVVVWDETGMRKKKTSRARKRAETRRGRRDRMDRFFLFLE